MTYNKWDIILVPFPFTDLSFHKKRPALVVSPNEYNCHKDIVIAFITSKIDYPKRLGDYRIQNLLETGLPKPSMIRMKFTTIDQTIVVKKLGELTSPDIVVFNNVLLDFFRE